jgi:hypothetical protein
MAAAVIAAVESPVTETGEDGVAAVAVVAAAVDADAAIDTGMDEEDVVASVCPFG